MMNRPPAISAPEKGASLTSSGSPVSLRPTISNALVLPSPCEPIHEILKPTSLSGRPHLTGRSMLNYRDNGRQPALLRHADCMERCPLSRVTRKTFARTEFFRVWHIWHAG